MGNWNEDAYPLLPACVVTVCLPTTAVVCNVGMAGEWWTIDCGASRHCVPTASMLSEVDEGAPGVNVQVANGQVISAACYLGLWCGACRPPAVHATYG